MCSWHNYIIVIGVGLQSRWFPLAFPAEGRRAKDLCGMCKTLFTARINPYIVVGHVLRDFNRLTYDWGAASTPNTFRMVSPPIKASLVMRNNVLGVMKLFVLLVWIMIALKFLARTITRIGASRVRTAGDCLQTSTPAVY